MSVTFTREARKQKSHLGNQAQAALRILEKHEREELIVCSDFCQALQQPIITFLSFTCLERARRKEEIIYDLFRTNLLRRFRKELKSLFEDMEEAGIACQFRIIIPDREPERTWGWTLPQGEVTEYCRMMMEDARPELPANWHVELWSDLEARVTISYEQCQRWAEQEAPALVLADETRFFRHEFPERFSGVVLNGTPDKLARRRIAGYAYEGIVLEEVFPRAILIQSEFPAKRKDAMFSACRKSPLLVTHPFSL